MTYLFNSILGSVLWYITCGLLFVFTYGIGYLIIGMGVYFHYKDYNLGIVLTWPTARLKSWE